MVWWPGQGDGKKFKSLTLVDLKVVHFLLSKLVIPVQGLEIHLSKIQCQ